MKGLRETQGRGRGTRLQEVVLIRTEDDRSNLPFDPRKDDKNWHEQVGSSYLPTLARIRPELKEKARAEFGNTRNLFSDLVPRNYAIEDDRGRIHFEWLNRTADYVQVFPELRAWDVPGLHRTFAEVAFGQIKQIMEGRLDFREPPYEFNILRLLRPALEICPNHKSEIYHWLDRRQTMEQIEYFISETEDPELLAEFSLQHNTGWIEALAAGRVLFPELSEKIQAFMKGRWDSLRQSIRSEKNPLHARKQLVSASILGARSAWIDETGEFHIEFPSTEAIISPKPLPERLTL